jgi:uncharacterized protein (TIGR02246 family)
MAEHPNVDLVRRVYTAFSAGDMNALSELFAPDIVWSVPGNSRLSGDHKGQDAVFALFALCGELSGGTLVVDPMTIESTGDNTVVSTHRVTAQRGDKKLDVVETENVTIENGKLTRADESVSDQKASDAFWV